MANSLLSEFLIQKETGYDQWLIAKISEVKASLKAGTMSTHTHDDAMDTAWHRLQAKAQTTSAE